MKKNSYLLVILLALANCMFVFTLNASTRIQPNYYPVRERMLTQSLNGTWKFLLIKGLTTSSEYNGWEQPIFNVDKWDDIIVPGNWETQGFKTPEYGSDLEEYTGLYRTTFKYNKAWIGKNVILRFNGVHFGYECYVNGTKVGEYGSAFNMCQFNITPYLNMNGKNVLSVKVSTRSFGWLFDTNDCWSLAGITRDVELFALENMYLEDITYNSDVTKDLNAIIKICVDINRFREDKKAYRLNVSLSDHQYNHLLNFSNIIENSKKKYQFEGQLIQPKLWTAETPNLYRLEVCIVDANGSVVQRVNEQVGVRSLCVDGFDLKVNHNPILLRGVCLNEIDPKLGRALTFAERHHQLEMMKKANINFIRTAHYPMGYDFLQLCDEMGFYVCVEVPFGSRGAKNLKKEEYKDELINRAEATLRRDKNHPSVIIWSLGNENPYTPIVEEVLKYVKTKDPTRPRGLPQKVGDFMNFSKKPSENVDVIMGHYLNDNRIDEAIKNTQKPIIHTEYAHSLGLAFGDFEAKYARILREPKVIGGSIWCWGDQTIMTLGDNQKNNVLKSVWLDSIRFIDSYGRTEVANGKSEVWKEAADGIVYGDGYPQEDFFLVRKVYSPVIVTSEGLKAELGVSNSFEIKVENRFDFISLRGYKMNWQIRNLNKVLQRGELWLQASSRNQEIVTVKAELPEDADSSDIMFCVEIMTPDGKALYEKNMPISIDGNQKDYRVQITSISKFPNFKSSAFKEGISANIGNTKFTVSDIGVLTITDSTDRKIIESPLYLRVGRPITITLDYLAQKEKFYWNPYILSPIIEKCETSKSKEGIQAKFTCRWNRNEKHEEYIWGVVTIHVLPNGVVELNYEITPSDNATGTLLECGITLKLSPSFDVFHWLGNGPYTNTPGKTAYNERGSWALHKNDLRFIGNRGLVDIAVVTSDQVGLGLWSNSKNIGIENIDGVIYVSQNAIVAGYGSKFTFPSAALKMNELKPVKGSFILFIDQQSKPVNFLQPIFKQNKKYLPVVPEQPYLKGYGW